MQASMNATSESSNTRLNSKLGVLIDKQNLLLDRIIDEVRVSPSQNPPNRGKQILRILEEMEFGLGQSSSPWPKIATKEDETLSPGAFKPGNTIKFEAQPITNHLADQQVIHGNSESTIGKNRKDPQRIDREKQRDQLLEQPPAYAFKAFQVQQTSTPDELGASRIVYYQGEADQRFERMLKAYHDEDRSLPNKQYLPRITLNNPPKASTAREVANHSKQTTPLITITESKGRLPSVNQTSKVSPKVMQDQSVQAERRVEIPEVRPPPEKPKIKKPKVIAEPVMIELQNDKKLQNSKLFDSEEHEKQNLNDVSVSSTDTVFGKDGARRKKKLKQPPQEPMLIQAEVAQSYRKKHPEQTVNPPSSKDFCKDHPPTANSGRHLPDITTKPHPGVDEKPFPITEEATPLTSKEQPSAPGQDQPKYIKVKLPNDQYVYLTRGEHLAFHLALREAAAAKNSHHNKREAGVETEIRGEDILDHPDVEEEADLNRQLSKPPSVVEVKRDGSGTPRVEVKVHKISKSLGTDGLFESGFPVVKPRNLEHLPGLQRFPQTQRNTKQSEPVLPNIKERQIRATPSDAGMGTMSDVRLSANESLKDPTKPVLSVVKLEKEVSRPQKLPPILEKSMLPSITMIGAQPSPKHVAPPKQESPKPPTKSFGGDFSSIVPPAPPLKKHDVAGQTEKVRSTSIETQHKPEEPKKSNSATLTDPPIQPKPVKLELVSSPSKAIQIPGIKKVVKTTKSTGTGTETSTKRLSQMVEIFQIFCEYYLRPQVTLQPLTQHQRLPAVGMHRVEPLTLERARKVEIGTATEDERLYTLEREDEPTEAAWDGNNRGPESEQEPEGEDLDNELEEPIEERVLDL